MRAGSERCSRCRWRCEGTGYCLWPRCFAQVLDEEKEEQEGCHGQNTERTDGGKDSVAEPLP